MRQIQVIELLDKTFKPLDLLLNYPQFLNVFFLGQFFHELSGETSDQH